MPSHERACGACGFRAETLTSGDATVALRSFPRRWRELLSAFESSEDGVALVRLRPPGGWSAFDHAVHVSRSLGAQADTLQRVRDLDRPSIDPAGTRAAGIDESMGVNEALAELARNAERLAKVAESMSGKDWLRSGERAGREVTALDLLRQGVHEGVHHLHQSKALSESLGGRSAADEEES